jgi:hypothetical protein
VSCTITSVQVAGGQPRVHGKRLQRRDRALQLPVNRDRQGAGNLDTGLHRLRSLVIEEGQ